VATPFPQWAMRARPAGDSTPGQSHSPNGLGKHSIAACRRPDSAVAAGDLSYWPRPTVPEPDGSELASPAIEVASWGRRLIAEGSSFMDSRPPNVNAFFRTSAELASLKVSATTMSNRAPGGSLMCLQINGLGAAPGALL
jgi:hypothetical protein